LLGGCAVYLVSRPLCGCGRDASAPRAWTPDRAAASRQLRITLRIEGMRPVMISTHSSQRVSLGWAAIHDIY
jgi:hypothetical protein